jgi:hypothetical protein
MLRPGFLDIPLTEQVKAINYMIVMAMMIARFANASLSTLIHPVHFQSEGIKYQPDVELLKTTNYGRFKPEPEFGSTGCTFWKPGRGTVVGLGLMRCAGHMQISMKLKRNTKKFNTSPDIQHTETLLMSSVPELNVYSFLGLGFRGQVMYIHSEDESDADSLLRIVDTALTNNDPEYEPNYKFDNLLANMLIGSTPLFKVTDIEFVNSFSLGVAGNEKYEYGLEFLSESPSASTRANEEEDVIEDKFKPPDISKPPV